MTTKNRRAVGTLGVVAVAAILMVSVVATNFAIEAEASEHQIAAKKAGMSMTNPVLAPMVKVSGGDGTPVSSIVDIGSFLIKSNDKGDWLVDATIECATAVQVVAKGKHSKDEPLDGAFAGAKVWFTIEENGAAGAPTPISIKNGSAGSVEDAQWNLCENVFEMKSNFNDLIIDCKAALKIDPDFASCVDADPNKLVFLCAVTGEEGDDACAQSLEAFSKVAGTHPATVLIHNVPGQGIIHNVTAWAQLEAGGSSNSTLTFTNMTANDNFVNAGVMIGKRIFVAEPIHMQTVTSEP